MFDTPIKIVEKSTQRDKLNQRVGDDVIIEPTVWAQRTESGGRENLYASRIVNEMEVVYTVRWNEKFKASQYVIEGDRRMKIVAVIQEGRRKYMHLKCEFSNG